MAKLQSNNLMLEIKFSMLEEDWIAYEIGFLWNNDLIINDDILKKGRWWDKRKYGTFLANDYETDCLIETLKKSLSTNKSEYWEPIEPDAKIAIYPERYFPFLKDHWVTVEETEEDILQDEGNEETIEVVKGEAKTIEEIANAAQDMTSSEDLSINSRKGTDEYDLFTIIAFIDTYNFNESKSYSSEGISLHLIATRKDLEKFVTDLETEYNELLMRKIDKIDWRNNA